MALKKPSDFFNDTNKTPLDQIKEEYDSARPEKIEKVSEAFGVFKDNLKNIQSISNFSDAISEFKRSVDFVDTISLELDVVKENIQDLVKKQDLDEAMMAHLLFVEKSIGNIENKISSINGETVNKIKEDFSNLSDSVESFIDIDVPKYKKLVSESEVRVDDRFVKFKEEIKENFDNIKSDTSKEVASVLETVESLNENIISDIKSDFRKTTKDVNNTVSDLVEKELPKYKKFFAETEIRTEEKIKTSIDSYQERIESLNATVKEFTEVEIPKYNNLLIENKIKSEEEVKELEEKVLSRVNSVTEKLESLSKNIDKKAFDRFEELQTVVGEYKEEINSISKTYESLYKDFKKREVYENKKLEDYSGKIQKFDEKFKFIEETVKEDLNEIQNVLIQSNETYHASLKKEVGKFKNKLSEQMKDLQIDLVTSENHIRNQTKDLQIEVTNAKTNIKDLIGELYKIATVVKKKQKSLTESLLNGHPNKELVEKIEYIEKTISEFNRKKLLVEDNPNLPGDPSNRSSDPLTPLDQKFVTLDQLQEHYRLFINRVQQQISTIGGGGETRLQYLDDIVGIATNLNAYDGMVLQVDVSGPVGKKFKFGNSGSGSVGAGGTWSSDAIGVSTTKNVGIATTARTDFALYVGGDQYVDGNITIGGTITYEDVKNVDSIGIVTARTGINVLAGGINAVGVVTATSFIGDGSGLTGIANTAIINSNQINVSGVVTASSFIGDGSGLTGIANTAIINSNQINVSGVVTASSFIGDGSGLSNIISGVGIQSGSVRVGTGFTDVNFTGVGITVVGSGTTITVNIPSTTITRQIETSSGITTNFTVTNGYTVGFIDVFRNGSKQITGVDFTATNGSTVTMVPAVSDGDVVEFQKFNALNIAGIASVTNATNAYNIVGGVSFATSAGIATALNSDSSINTSGIITASSLDAAISEWVLGANGSSDYTFTGPGLTGAENDPSLYLIRGQKYNFKNSSGGHPFRIQSTPNGSTGTQYNDGVTNNDAGNGTTLIWNVQFDAPEVLYYQCTSHSSMGGKIYIGNSGESIVVGSAVTINSSGINVVGVITATSFDGVPEGTNILKAMLFV